MSYIFIILTLNVGIIKLHGQNQHIKNHLHILYICTLIFIISILYIFFSKPFSIIISLFCFIILIIKLLPSKIDEILHSKIIRLPLWLKCKLNINCSNRSCNSYNKNNWESQINSDIDWYTLGHFILDISYIF